jgi:hypothetical protein
MVWMVDSGYKQTFVSFFCLIKDALFGAIVRAPFLGPSTLGLKVLLLGFHLFFTLVSLPS